VVTFRPAPGLRIDCIVLELHPVPQLPRLHAFHPGWRKQSNASEQLYTEDGELLSFPSLTWWDNHPIMPRIHAWQQTHSHAHPARVVQNFFQSQIDGETPTDWLHRLLEECACVRNNPHIYSNQTRDATGCVQTRAADVLRFHHFQGKGWVG
jgi:hypothetical protein